MTKSLRMQSKKKNEEELNQAGEQVFATYSDFIEQAIKVGEQVFATYSDFIHSCEEYPEDEEDDEDYVPDPWDDYEEDETTTHET